MIDGVGVVVAGGDDDGRAQCDGGIDRGLRRVVAGAAATQAHVRDFGGIGIGRHARHAAACGPDQAIGDVGSGAAADTQHAHRHDLRAPGHADDALAVVADGADGAGDVGAMPVRVRGGAEVARIAGIAVSTIAVVGHRHVGDEVVAGQNVRVEIAVVGDAGVDDRDHHAATGVEIPCLVGADAGIGVEHAPEAAVAGVVRGECRLQDAVDLDVLHVGVGGDLLQQDARLFAVELARGADHVGAERHASHVVQKPGRCLRAARARVGIADPGARSRSGRLQRSLPRARTGRRRAAGAELDDEAVELLRRRQAGQLHALRGRGLRRHRYAGQAHGEQSGESMGRFHGSSGQACERAGPAGARPLTGTRKHDRPARWWRQTGCRQDRKTVIG